VPGRPLLDQGFASATGIETRARPDRHIAVVTVKVTGHHWTTDFRSLSMALSLMFGVATGDEESLMGEHARVLVIGGGPAGSTAAGLLARQGIQVTLLESSTFPRYHIGESILPSVLPVLDLLGAREKVEKYGFVRKNGAYFEWGPENWDLNFDHLSGAGRYSYQVIRSEFDHILLDNAAELGVDVRQGVKVTEIRFDEGRPVAAQWVASDDRSVSGEIGFDFLVDASGRGGVMATKYLKNRRFQEAFKNIAVWSYWRGVTPLDRGPSGAIAVCSVPSGWFWAIPLHDGTYSIGLVAKRTMFASERDRLGSIDAVYFDALDQCPRIAAMVAGAERQTDFKVEQDYSYTSDSFTGPGYLMIGDAACFLDPLLSTGVHLARSARCWPRRRSPPSWTANCPRTRPPGSSARPTGRRTSGCWWSCRSSTRATTASRSSSRRTS